MDASASSIAAIVRDLRVFSRSDPQEAIEPTEVPALIDHVLRLLGHDLVGRAVIERDYASDLPTLLLPHNRVVQVLTNLLTSAAHAMAEIDRPLHKLVVRVRADEDCLVIAIGDTGPGIPPDALERIFDPFFTTKEVGSGTGLGLSIAYSIAQEHGGSIAARSGAGGGATFEVELPLAAEEPGE